MAPVERRPTWAEIDLAAIVHNYRLLESLARESRASLPLLPVVKADAYGHGAVPVARALAAEGASMFGVAIVEEAVALRDAGIGQDIVVLEGAWPGQEPAVWRHRLLPAVYSPDGIRRLQLASDGSSPLPVHLKIDTGMARLGARWDSLDKLVAALREAPALRVAGIFSHFASADEDDPAFTLEQIRRFETALETLESAGIRAGCLHLANSAGLLHVPQARRYGARPGIALYGYPPIPERCDLPLRPALTLKSRIGHVHELRPGESAGYNRRFTAGRVTRAGTVPAGYADGVRRGLTGRARVSIGGRQVPVLGTISMDMLAVDLTDVPAAVEGDELILMGPEPGITAEEWAAALGTISYEVLCGISPRVPRLYS